MLILFPLFVKAQSLTNNADTALKSFVVLYTTGESWDHTKKPQEQAYFMDHSKHLGSLRTRGVIKIGGRYSDKGMLIIQAKSMADAESLITADKAISNKLFNASIFPVSFFMKGCID